MLTLIHLPFVAVFILQKSGPLLTAPGIMITIVLLFIPLLVLIILMLIKTKRLFSTLRPVIEVNERDKHTADHDQLLSNVSQETSVNFMAAKRKAEVKPSTDSELTTLILWFIITAACWLVIGTTIGEYLGIKFVSPDLDHYSWLSFGRLRPVHTNAVFWGWSSLAMMGVGYYVVPRVSNVEITSIKAGWWSLGLINSAVIIGSILLMSGVNNGGGEFREYIWPVQLLFALGLLVTLINFLGTVARRNTKEIYVSNWYIISAVMFAIVLTVVGYIPAWQEGLGETIVQGYYMHQGVGMWFMLFTLGLLYYFLPQQLNRPIYSYSLGVLAFWAQIFFYTVIGTHHFVFSAIPWYLQTIAIIGSVGMVIPVLSGTTNFLMTFNGAWNKVTNSYTLPFFIVGILFYFTGSLQGTAEAFRYTNLMWHFTDFTVAHSHLTMYGIIAFMVWGCIYSLVPRLTGIEPPQATVGLHFWAAFIGLLLYSIPLMIGGTLRGYMWMGAKPFIDSVVMMAPYWLWRAIGGTMMWVSHLVFAYNLYKMIGRSQSRKAVFNSDLPHQTV